jgi:HAD superfamily 5'-nucleotidase-like hydrolase
MKEHSEFFTGHTYQQLLKLFQASGIRYNRRVFCNRNLRMEKIRAIGLDMDYTLAIYTRAFDELAFRLALDRLVERHGFPRETLQFQYDPDFSIRGLVVDLKLGNLFKMDRHRHVSRAFHGTRNIPIEERMERYRKKPIHLSRPQYYLVDTLFALPETHMFAQLVDLLDRTGMGDPRHYEEGFRSIRSAVDEIHQDGTLKSLVMKDLGRYVVQDPDIAATLQHFLAPGKKCFLLTNSEWDYTQAVMSYLLDGVGGRGTRWFDHFDTIVAAANKPSFFTRTAPPAAERGAPAECAGKVFRSGSIAHMEQRLGCAGDQILYIGDHIYGDMLKSKRTSSWRTTMIIPEMESELDGVEAVREELFKFDRLFRRREQASVETNYQQRLLNSLMVLQEFLADAPPGALQPAHNTGALAAAAALAEGNVRDVKASLSRIEDDLSATVKRIHAPFNKRWGMLFKEGTVHSVFGEQTEQYACTYTSRFSNFLAYSPNHYFRTGRDVLAHEREV